MSKVEETLTPQQAADMLGVSVRTIREWIKSGQLAVTRSVGNRCLIERTSVEAQMQKSASPSKTLPALAMKRFCHGFEVPANFDLITTYEELAQYSKAFGNGDIIFMLLIGSPGSGKSKQLKMELASRSHVWIDNHATNLGLYCSVYGANNSPIVLDDINHLFKNKMACSLMKSLTQTDEVRSVSWESTTKVLEEMEVPRRFETSSPICLIGNMWNSSDADMAAIQDRSLPVAFYPSAETIHEQVLRLGWCEREVADFVGKYLGEIPQPSMREYYQGMVYRRAGMRWREKLLKLWELD